jgi:hypothetical protein
MKRKIILAFLAILFSFAIAKGQNQMVINFIGSASVSTAFSNIQKITFDDDNMVLKGKNGAENSYQIDNIASITFLHKIGIREFNETIDVNIFVNASGEIVVESPYQINKLTVFDLIGREMAISSQSKMNVNFLNTGVYILQIITNKGIVTKKFIINK